MVKIFISYAHEDSRYRDTLEKHLANLRRQKRVQIWSDKEIGVGAKWEQEILDHFNSSQIIVLLISPDFINSDFAYAKELEAAVKRSEAGRVELIPVIVRHCEREDSILSSLQCLFDEKPVFACEREDPDAPWIKIVEEIKKKIHRIESGGRANTAREPNELAIKEIIDYYANPFVGRAEEAANLMEFARQETPGYKWIEAPAAYGKTALFAHLIRRCETRDWKNPPLLLYFFTRKHGNGNSSAAFFRALNSQLLTALDSNDALPDDPSKLRLQFARLWAMAVQTANRDKPLLVLVDSLDEMVLEEVTIADLLPASLSSYVHIVVSSRPNPQFLQQIPLWHPLRKSSLLSLGKLDKTDIENLLRAQGASDSRATILAPQIEEMTAGEPLFARFVCEDVAKEGEAALARLKSTPHPNVDDYFREQFKTLKTESGPSWDIVALVTLAPGITLEEIGSALDMENESGERIKPVWRFLLGKTRLEIMHLKLREVILQDLGKGGQTEYRRKLLKWCRSFQKKGWPENTPEYVVLHYSGHLRDDGDRDALYALLTKPWMHIHRKVAGSYETFAKDLQLVMAEAASDQPPNLLTLARGCLIRGNLNSLASNIPPEVLGLMTALGSSTEARGYANLIQDKTNQCQAYRRIAEALLGKNKPDKPAETEEARTLLHQALAVANALPKRATKVEVLASLGPPLSRVGELTRLIATASGLEDYDRRELLLGLADAFVRAGEPGGLKELLPLAQSFEQPWYKPEAYSAVAAAMLRLGDDTAVEHALELVTKEEHASIPARLFEELVKARRSSQAFALLKGRGDQFEASYLGDIARTAAELGQIDVLDEALKVKIDHPWTQAQAIGAVALGFAEVGQNDRAVELAHRALALERPSEFAVEERAIEEFEAEAASVLAFAGDIGQARSTIGPIQDESIRTRALNRIAAAELKQGVAAGEEVNDIGPKLDEPPEVPLEARRFSWGGQEALALLEQSRSFLNLGDSDKAIETAKQAVKTARESYARWLNGREDNALSCIASALARAGDLKSAFEVHQRVRLWGESVVAATAVAVADAGDYANAWITAQGRNSVESRSSTLTRIAQVAARKRDISSVKETVERIPGKLAQNSARSQMAEHFSELGDLATALEFARAIEDDATAKAKALGGVGLVLVRSGKEDFAREVVHEARALTQAIRNDVPKVAALCAIAEALSAQDQKGQERNVLDRTIEIARAIKNPDARTQAFTHVARRLAESGERQRAAEFVNAGFYRTTETGDVQVSTVCDFAMALAKSGETSRVVELVNWIVDALKSTDKTPGVTNARPDLLLSARAAAALARVGQTEEAMKRANDILTQVEVLGQDKAPKSGVPGGGPLEDFFAKLYADWTAIREEIRAWTTSEVARTFAESGDRRRAVETALKAVRVAEEITLPAHKSSALVAVARNLLEMGEEQRASQILMSAYDIVRLAATDEVRTSIEIQLAPLLLRCGLQNESLSAWTRAASRAHVGGRTKAFEALAAGVPLIAASDGVDNVRKLYETIVEVESWWNDDRSFSRPL